MLCYKQLWTVEQTFRTAKHLLSTRPIFHKLDATIRGHVFCSFLALVLKKALEDRIAALARSGSWPEIIADLDSLTETEIEHDGKRFVVEPRLEPPRCLPPKPEEGASAPVLHDDLWRQLADPWEKVWCAPCLFERADKRLGRQLCLADLRPCAFNLLNKPSWFDLLSSLEPQDPALIEQRLGA